MGRKREKRMEIKVRIAEEADVERVAVLYEKLHDYLETHENHPRWKRGIYPTKADAEEGFQKGWLYVAEADGKLAGSVIYLHGQGDVYNQVKWSKEMTIMYMKRMIQQYGFMKAVDFHVVEPLI